MTVNKLLCYLLEWNKKIEQKKETHLNLILFVWVGQRTFQVESISWKALVVKSNFSTNDSLVKKVCSSHSLFSNERSYSIKN